MLLPRIVGLRAKSGAGMRTLAAQLEAQGYFQVSLGDNASAAGKALADAEALLQAPGAKVAFTGIKHLGEITAIRSLGGAVLQIERPGQSAPERGARNFADSALDGADFDGTIINMEGDPRSMLVSFRMFAAFFRVTDADRCT